MNAKSIQWHEETLQARLDTLDGYLKDLSILTKRINELKSGIEFYRKQIDRAKEQGKDSFDRDRFLVK